MKIENISTLENSTSTLSITLRENTLKKDGSYYASVSRNTASFRNILSEIAEDNKGIDPFILQYSAILMQKKILKMLEQGKAVNVLDLGIMYIAMKCNAKRKSDVPENGNFYIKFAPTNLANDAVSSLSVDKVVFVERMPEILNIENLATAQADGTMQAGKALRITGNRLKLGGNGCGLYLAPSDENGILNEDESDWIKVQETAIFRNMPKELNFFVPDNVQTGTKYSVIIRTAYISKNISRKEPVEIRSETVTAV